MKLISTINATGSVGMAYSANSIDFNTQAQIDTAQWLSDALYVNIMGVSSALPSAVVLWGCTTLQEFLGPGLWLYVLLPGVILYNGILYFVSSTSTTGGSFPIPTFYGNLAVTNGYGDPEQFSDGNFHNVHNDTYVATTTSATGALFNFSTIARMTDVPTQISTAVTAATTPILTGGVTASPIYSGTYVSATGSVSPITLRKSGNLITVDGMMNNTSGLNGVTTDQAVFTLPSGWAPNKIKYREIIGDLTANNDHRAYVKIDTAGLVTVMGTKGSFSTNFGYMAFNFYIDM